MAKNPVIDYYHSLESRLGYRYLKGVKHFGYYPEDQEGISKLEAQMLMNEELAKRLSLPAGLRVLDAGCGEGNVALYLAEKRGLHIDGIDLLDFNINRAYEVTKEKNLSKSVNFQIGSYMELPFADASFDGVYTMETLVHAPDYRQALKEFHRVLKPGGKIVHFEYSIKPSSELLPSQQAAMERLRRVNLVASMPAFNEFEFGTMTEKWQAAGFNNVKTEDITARMLPMLKKFYGKARLPYKLFRVLGLENHVINAMSAVEFYEHQDLWKYEITTALKP